VENRIRGKVGTNGNLSGPEFQNIDSTLGDDAHTFLQGNGYEKQLGRTYLDLQDKMRDWIERVSPPNVATDLQKANLAFRTAKPIESAARATPDPEGFFTITHLRNGARSASPSQFAVGQAPMQQFANNAELQRDATPARRARQRALGLLVISRGHRNRRRLLAGAYGLFQHPEWLLQHPILSTIAALGYPALKGLYSTPTGRELGTSAVGLLGQCRRQLVPLVRMPHKWFPAWQPVC
jgi:hypothetical protein